MTHRVPKCLGRLPGQRSAGCVSDRPGDHDRKVYTGCPEGTLKTYYCGFRVQRVEYRFDHQEIDATFNQGNGG